MEKNILFVGAGSMAEAMISGIVKSGIVGANHIYVTNRQNEARLAYLNETYAVQTSYDDEQLFQTADVVFLAMKPKDVAASLMKIRPYIRKEQLFISVIAGVETSTIEKLLEIDASVIRVMPNTSAAVGYSTTAITSGKYTNEVDVVLAEKLLQTIGVTKVVKEADMDVVTAISGSGPAYIYYFVEAIKQAAEKAGFDQATAEELMTHTIIGAGKMLEESADSPETLIKNITSEGGTTEAGLKALEANGFAEAVLACIDAAKTRSKELAELYK